jgi:hypothetical protein
MKKSLFVSLLIFVFGVASSAIAQVGVDGVRGSEWNGISATSVLYDVAAPTSNFATPTNKNHTVAYDIYVRSDNNYVYGFLETKPAGAGVDNYNSTLAFTNLYFSTNPFGLGGAGSGSIGFELQNDRAFKPGGSGYLSGTLSSLGFAVVTVTGTQYGSGAIPTVVEFAAPWTYFTSDPQAAPFVPIDSVNNKLRLNLSQSFGYSVAGGDADYGSNRLGVLTYSPVPEPASILAVSLGAICFLRRKRK